jgi:hypothetical protein
VSDGFGSHYDHSRGALGSAVPVLLRRSAIGRQPTALDPEPPFEIGSMNGQEALESGRRLKAWVGLMADPPRPGKARYREAEVLQDEKGNRGGDD